MRRHCRGAVRVIALRQVPVVSARMQRVGLLPSVIVGVYGNSQRR
ncbi:hypothetical protein XCR_0624 [Xanthomonas campestris pv. raphani 756C]|nr:hypothetical protein XCR_0624 [Xanthomonas campestris pv. raphani 756C]